MKNNNSHYQESIPIFLNMDIIQPQSKIQQRMSQHQTVAASTVPTIFAQFVRKFAAIQSKLNAANTGIVQRVS